MSTTLNEMRRLVEQCQEFKGNSVFAKHFGDKYVVYSYGQHFPMYVWDYKDKLWVGNESKYSTTTSRHQSKCKPSGVSKWLDAVEMRKYLDHDSYTQYMILRGG